MYTVSSGVSFKIKNCMTFCCKFTYFLEFTTFSISGTSGIVQGSLGNFQIAQFL